MLHNLLSLPRLLLDPFFTTCLVVAVVSAITFFNMRKEEATGRGMKIMLVTLFTLTSGLILLTLAMALIFGPPPG